MSRRTLALSVFLVPVVSAVWAVAAEKSYTLQIAAPAEDRTNLVVKPLIAVPQELADAQTATVKLGGATIVGQLTPPGLHASANAAKQGEVMRQLHFVVPQLRAGQATTAEAVISTSEIKTAESFAWKVDGDKQIDLTYGGKLVARYMCEPYTTTTPADTERTYKVYHHVFDPTGETRLTKGPGSQYTHHRGIFYGFSKVAYGDKKSADIWHCKGGVHQAHAKVLTSSAGPVVGRHLLQIDWIGADGKPFAQEQRELSFYHAADGLLVEFASRLTPLDGTLKLNGDPQHAGFQFRASEEVAETTKGQTYYIRPDGVDKTGATRQGQQQPWNAMSFVVAGQRYTCCYLDSPTNPKPPAYSERDYGRFGSYFVTEAKQGETVDVDYRLWIQPNTMEVAEVEAQAKNFTAPPQATWK